MTEYDDESLKEYLEHYSLIGQRFGRLTVIAFDGFRKRKSYWLCQCDCGNQCVVMRHNLTGGRTQSCGCLARELTGNKGMVLGRRMDKKEVDERTEKWIINHYKHTKNDEICSKYGVCHSWLYRFARKHGLTKSKQFMKAVRADAAAKARSVRDPSKYVKKGQTIPMGSHHYFPIGHCTYVHLSPEKQAERNRKVSESMKQVYFKERARVDFGLPQRTRLKVYGGGHNRACYRYLLKQKGYVIEGRASNDAYVTAETRRSPEMEATAIKHGMHIIVNQ